MITFLAGYTLCLGITLMLLTVSNVEQSGDRIELFVTSIALTLTSAVILA